MAKEHQQQSTSDRGKRNVVNRMIVFFGKPKNYTEIHILEGTN